MCLYLPSQTIQSLVNLNQKVINATGLCGTDSATLSLTQQTTILNFTFSLVRASFI